ncbi:MAG: hypothetical protein HQ582_18540, partial [Planctomycetes bacterium]|nr:hypothetical protein [Planctomycetota bacterium]
MGSNRIRAGRSRRTALRGLWVAVFFVAGTAAALAQPKIPAPDDDAQAKAKELLRQVYGAECENAKSPDEKAAVARKMLSQAAGTKGEPASHFVLLQAARNMAIQAADAKTALEAAEQTTRHYQVDAPAMRIETVLKAAANARLSEQRKAVVEAAIPLIRVAVDEDEYETANRLVPKVLDLARRSRDAALVKRMVVIQKELAESRRAYVKVEKAQAVLEDNPTDPDANLTVGRYTCLAKGNWGKGMAMLALGSDARLKAMAVKELEGPTSVDEEVALADGWWELAQAEQGDVRKALMLRAGSWYQWSQARVSSLIRVKIDRRLEEIGVEEIPKLARDVQQPVFTFDDEALTSRYWLWNDEWTMGDDGGKVPRGSKSFLRTRYAYEGDLSIDLDFSFGGARYSNTGGCWITVWGKKLTISNTYRRLTARIHVHREGDEIVFTLNGQEERIPVESDVWS